MSDTNKTKKPEFSYYEGYNYGPIKLERIGRNVLISSKWQPEQFKRHIQRVKKGRPKLRGKIEQKIGEILTLIQKFDPLAMLASVSATNCFGDPEEYREVTHKELECYAEYAQSLILGNKCKECTKQLTKEAIEHFNNLITEIHNDILWYFISEVTEHKRDPIEEELRNMSIQRYLFMRGDSYLEHHIDMVASILREHDDFLKHHYSFTYAEIEAGIQHILKQLNENMQQQSMIMSLLHELHELFKEFADRENSNKYSSFEEYRKKYLSLPAVQKKKEKLDELSANIGKNPFEIRPTKEIPIELLKLFSSQFGCNSHFINFPKSPAWPTNNTIIHSYPLIENKDKFYCFIPQLLVRNIGNIIEEWIKRKDIDYFQEVYQKKRAEYLEKKMIEYMSNMLPGAEVYRKLYYNTYENGEKKRNETDGMILFDENLFIIEGKAGGVSISARRGSIDSMRTEIKELIDDAYEQAVRTKNYILTTKKPVFETENGARIFIRDKNKYSNIYLVNVTLQNLGPVATQLHLIKKLDLIRGKEWPWSVFINDLRVISELIEFPSEFLHFLMRRIQANEYPQFRSIDELDFLMFYFKEGLYLEENTSKDTDIQIPCGYTESLDRYYDFVAGRVSSGEKPQLDSPSKYKELVKKIETTQKLGFTQVGTTLLNLDRKVQQDVIDKVINLHDQSKKDGKDHNISLIFNDFGLTFYLNRLKKRSLLQEIHDYANSKMREIKVDKWIFIIIEDHRDVDYSVSFQIYNRTD